MEDSKNLISRQAAIDALAELKKKHFDHPVIMRNVMNAIQELPSARPKLEQNTPPEQGESEKLGAKTGETCTDTISRQAAIEIVDFECGEWRGLAETIIKRLSGLSPAQPEQRSFSCGWQNDSISRKVAIRTMSRLEPSFRGSVLEQALKNMPPAQPKIIKCKDCKHYYDEYRWCNYIETAMKPSDYCSRVKRREG